MAVANPSSTEIHHLLSESRVIAVVGLSPKPERDSHRVAAYLQRRGYQIIPVNPGHPRLLDQVCYPRLSAIPAEQPIDIVNLFRRSELVGPHVDEAIARGGVKMIWMQIGIEDEAAARRAEAAGIRVVMNRCLMVDHAALLGR